VEADRGARVPFFRSPRRSSVPVRVSVDEIASGLGLSSDLRSACLLSVESAPVVSSPKVAM